jgi:hypothetical protein
MTLANRSKDTDSLGDASVEHESHHDWRRDSASEAVVRAVATAENCGACDLPPLHGSIDPDALNALFSHGSAGSTDISVEFPYDGWHVRVAADGSVTVHDG